MKLLIAGGGTGGHVYPALAIAKAFLAKKPNSSVDFIGTSQGIENKIIPQENLPLHLIEIGRLNSNVSIKERILTLINLPIAFCKSFLLLIKLKPDAVLGVGGYASGPIVFIASLLGFKTFIWEPNAYPGLANRILSRFVKTSFIVFDEAKKHLHGNNFIKCNVPVRPSIENLTTRVPKTSDFCILIFGGSQGSRAINNVCLEAIRRGGNWMNQIRIVHQTGSTDFAAVQRQYEEIKFANGHVECLEYLHDMPARYQWADIVISRSGVGTLAELAAIGKASILIPLPTAADDHQTKNAMALVEKEAAIILPQAELTPDRLVEEILKLKNHPELISKIEKNIRQFHSKNAAETLAAKIVQTVGDA